jgi:hypothetical protein
MDADVSESATCFHIHRLNNQGRMSSTYLRVTASLGSITDTLNYNWGFAYANGFPSWLKITNAHTQHLTFIALILAVLWFGGFMGFEPTVAWKKTEALRVGRQLVKSSCLRGNAGHAPSLHHTLYSGILLQVRKNQGKTTVRVATKCQLCTIQLVDMLAVLCAAFHQPYFALQVTLVNLHSAQAPAELRNGGVFRFSQLRVETSVWEEWLCRYW